MWMRRIAGVLCALLVSVPSTAPIEGAQAQKKGQQDITLRVTTRLVEVSVIVQDSKGQPVEGLKAEDFALSDNNLPQQISEFSVQSTSVVSTTNVALPEHVFSNRTENKPGVPTSATVILMDSLNTKLSDQSYARDQVMKVISTLKPQDRIAIYALTTKLDVLQDFTSDPAILRAAAMRYHPRYSFHEGATEYQIEQTTDAPADAFVNRFNQMMSDWFNESRAMTTADAFQAIANHLARVPGRKSIVWVTGGFPFDLQNNLKVNTSAAIERLGTNTRNVSPGITDSFVDLYGTELSSPGSLRDPRTFDPEIRRAVRALNDANIAVYPIDARGLIGATLDPEFNSPGRFQRLRMGQSPSVTLGELGAVQDTMVAMAERTGGHAYYNTNDIANSVRQSLDDSRVTYLLGYYPSHGTWDGKWRDIKVVLKHPGYKLRYRKGYFANTDQAADPMLRASMLRQALSGTLDFTRVGLTVHVAPATLPGGRGMQAELIVASNDLTLQSDRDHWLGSIDCYYVQLGADEKEVDRASRRVNMDLTEKTYKALRENGLTLNHSLVYAPGATQVRIVVQDVNSGSVGSVTIPFRRTIGAPR
jgi:VWFA-related protein